MATNNTDLFSYLPGLEVTQNEVLEAELATQQILQAKFPDIDLREGTALRDLVIRPNATLLALVNKALVFYFQQNTLDGITDSTPQTFVDKLMSNWFLTRKLGRTAVINARLYFAKSKNVVLYPDVFFSTDGKLRFNPSGTISVSSSQLTFDVSANQYYVDVDLTAAAAGKDYNITAGSLLYFTNFDPYFLHAEINYLKEIAEDIETNTQFISRAKAAISTRNLINVPSISSNLLEYFDFLDGVLPIGMGDPLMTRDQIKVLTPGVTDPIWIHNGGCVDVYSRVPLSSSILQLTTDNTGKITMSGSIYKFERSLISGGTTDDTIPFATSYTSANKYLVTATPSSITRNGQIATVTCDNHGLMKYDRIKISGADQSEYNGVFVVTSTPSRDTFTYSVTGTPYLTATGALSLTMVDRMNDVGFSERQQIVIDFGMEQANQTASFVLYLHQNIDGIQSYLDDAEKRVLCGDLLARGFNLTLLDFEIVGYNGVAPNATTASTVIDNYLKLLEPGQSFIMADLLAQLYAAGIQTIKTPLTITYTKYWNDLLGTTSGTITDVMYPDDNTSIFIMNSVTTSSTTIV